MQTELDQERRTILKLGAALPGSFMLACVEAGANTGTRSAGSFQPNAWIRIDPDSSVTIVVAESEMGQGVLTSMVMLVAEELEADWKLVRVQQAPVDPVFGWQGTGGSTSVRQGWKPLREAGAAAREMLRTAAAREWQVPPTECVARNGEILHPNSGRRAGYGQLASLAAREPVPSSVRLKEPTEFKLIGKPLKRLDTPSKTNGSAVFGADVRLPGMLYAAICQCPVFGGRLASVRSVKARAVNGVRDVVELDSAVAVTAESSWSAMNGLKALEVEWNNGSSLSASSATISTALQDALKLSGEVVRDSVADVIRKKSVVRQVEAIYSTPFQAHATMEPMCCTVRVRGEQVEIWAPTQQPTGLQRAVAQLLTGEMDPAPEVLRRVTVHTTLLGGGFGRRNLHDFALQAVQIARKTNAPVQLLWSREEDMQHGYYHPATSHRLRAGLDRQGRIVGWDHKQCGSTYTSGAEELPYHVVGQRLEKVKVPTGIPMGPWRSVSHAYTAYAVECFVDELAAAMGQDPVVFRAEQMRDPRLRAVLKLAADRAGWGKRQPKGHHLGIAAHTSFGSHVAEVVELSVAHGVDIRVHRVTCVIDCGMVVNPDTVVAQMEGSIAWALTAALKGAITIRDGRVEQSNFHDYPVWHLEEMPAIDVHIVPSQAEPGGVGEPGVPPLAPALANAVFAATGRRIRHLPIMATDLR